MGGFGGRGESLGVAPVVLREGMSMMKASSTFWPLGKNSSNTATTRSSGLIKRLTPVRVLRYRVRSGESYVLPSELANFRRIMSRASSTRSLGWMVTSVAEPAEPLRLMTQILRSGSAMLLLSKSSPSDDVVSTSMRCEGCRGALAEATGGAR